MRQIVLLSILVAACTAQPGAVRQPKAETGGIDSAINVDSDECALGLACNPILVGAFPWADSRDTLLAPGATFDGYACAPGTSEAGGEFVYAVDVGTDGILSLGVSDGEGVDVDLHLLSGADPGDCVTRHDSSLAWPVTAGRWFIVVDTYASDGNAGAYDLVVDLVVTAGTPCAMTATDVRMFWSECAPGIDCYEADYEGSPARFLRTPAVGPVVMEAHLVTVADDFGGGWPNSSTHGLEDHYALSEAASGFDVARDQVWAPEGEGGSQWGQAAYTAPLPVLDEAWYVNMYWRARPPAGTRMLVIDGATGKAVVTAGGYETGPGSNTAIGGAVEEVHRALGSGHRDHLVMGFAADASAALGPVDCR